MDNKVNTNRIAEKAGVPCPCPTCWPREGTTRNLLQVAAAKLGNDLVVQTAFRRQRTHHLLHQERGRLPQVRQGDRGEKECK
jgi:hypothetical protein